MRTALLTLSCLAGLAAWPALSYGQSLDPNSLAGVYKHRFKNAFVSGVTYDSENIMEIVPIASDRAYIRLSLQFYNGHTCSFAGIARVAGERLIYRASGPNSDPCELSFIVSDGTIIVHDKDGQCRKYGCGARGGYENLKFSLTKRREIRYMDRLKASMEFKEALEEDAQAAQ